MPVPCPDFVRGATALAMAAGLMGLLTLRPAIAQETSDRKRAETDRMGQTQTPAGPTPMPGAELNHSAQDDSPLDTAIRLLLCLAAREAFEDGQPGRQIRQWVLMHGHRCPDAERQVFEPGEF